MLGINFKDVDAAGTYKRPTAGGYVIQIVKATNNPSKERIDIDFDFAEGDFAGYYQDLYARRSFWGGSFNKSYKEKAKPFFKAFVQTLADSNPPDVVKGLIVGDFEDVDEAKMVGLRIGMVVGDKEYMGNDGRLKVKIDAYNAEFVTPDVIHNGDFEVPEFKPYEEEKPAASNVVDTTADGFGPMTDDDTPF